METLRLGKTGMMVSRLGFGGIPIQRVSEDEAVAVVRRCLELGINYIDTANAYTTSEERIGKAISGRRQDVFLATKSGAQTHKSLESHLKLSLEHFGVEYIDLYQFHGIDDLKTLDIILDPDNGLIGIVEEAKKAGVVKHIGITSHSMQIAKEAVKSDRFETIMFPLNFIASEAAGELLPLAREHDVGFIAMKPLAGGKIDNIPLAFKYLFQFPDIIPIPGIEKIEEIEEIVQILEGPIND
ncbi:aldo/keto reductase [Chloroflexota bacterium]